MPAFRLSPGRQCLLLWPSLQCKWWAVPLLLVLSTPPALRSPPPARLEAQQREAGALAKALAGLRSETSRLNGLLAEAAGLRSTLHEGNLLLEGKLQQELKARGRINTLLLLATVQQHMVVGER